ncbi:MAG: DUF648 domain-containing protein [Patescibacteria group bacterium]|nr:DUF648 domain-containing protein [Patescibacteria group bacterium]
MGEEHLFLSEVDKCRKISLNWAKSKEYLSNFTRDLFDLVKQRSPVFSREFYEEFSGVLLDNFIYELGHPGRGSNDFPYFLDLSLQVQNYSSQEGAVRFSVAAGDFYREIASKVRSYLDIATDTSIERNYFQRHIQFLERLAQELDTLGINLVVNLSESVKDIRTENVYEVKGIFIERGFIPDTSVEKTDLIPTQGRAGKEKSRWSLLSRIFGKKDR